MLHPFVCPQCHHATELTLDPSAETTSVSCARCGAQSLVPRDAAPPGSEQAAVLASASLPNESVPDPPRGSEAHSEDHGDSSPSSLHGSPAIRGRIVEGSREVTGEGSPAGGQGPRAILGRLVERSGAPEGGFWSVLMGRIPAGSPDPNLVFTGVVAVLITLLLMLVLLRPIRSTGVGARLYDRGWVPYVIIGFSVWAFTILAMKLRALLRQRRWLAHLSTVGIPEIRQRDAGLVRTMIRKRGVDPRSFAGNRVLLGLDHFEARGDASEVSAMLAGQAANDEARIEASYLMLRVLIWAVPIVGFIGTVIGIGAAVQGFAETLGHAQEFEVIKGSLTKVTGGLAVAFDTTLVALLMSIFIMFPTNALQKAEMLLLTATERLLATDFLGKLRGLAGAPSGGGSGAPGPIGGEASDRLVALLEEIRTDLHRHAELQAQLLQASRSGAASHDGQGQGASTEGKRTPADDPTDRESDRDPDRGPDRG